MPSGPMLGDDSRALGAFFGSLPGSPPGIENIGIIQGAAIDCVHLAFNYSVDCNFEKKVAEDSLGAIPVIGPLYKKGKWVGEKFNTLKDTMTRVYNRSILKHRVVEPGKKAWNKYIDWMASSSSTDGLEDWTN